MSIYASKNGKLRRLAALLRTVRSILLTGFLLIGTFDGEAGERVDRISENRANLEAYFSHQIERIGDPSLTQLASLAEWDAERETYRERLGYMLGLDPMPAPAPLNSRITGKVAGDGFTVHKLHFQSLPGLYVTANLYVPHDLDEPAPAVLILCGHIPSVRDGVSFGNKASYQHFPARFARNGYVALIVDTIQHGEIRGRHLGTRRDGLWWWNSRGYTPAGVEAFNAMRALDYLETRDDVDAGRIAGAGHSGGGIGTIYLAALDERVAVAAPVSGVADLRNHVGDFLLSSHCDCNYFPNAYRFDFDRIVSLIAPRPLLLAGADRDPIFPLDGLRRIHRQVRHVYELYGSKEAFGLTVAPGGHEDTQMLRVPVFAWIDAHLKGDRSLIDRPAERFADDAELRVFDELPEDEIVTEIDHSFVPSADVPVPDTVDSWRSQRDAFRARLEEVTFGGWTRPDGPVEMTEVFRTESDGIEVRAVDLAVQPHVTLRLYGVRRADAEVEGIVLRVLDEEDWVGLLGAAKAFAPDAFAGELAMYPDVAADPARAEAIADTLERTGRVHLYLAPRGIGRDRWAEPDAAEVAQIRRAFVLLGQTLDGQRVLDVLRAIEAIRAVPGAGDLPLTLQGRGPLGGIALYAALYAGDVDSVELANLPASHRNGPELMNVLRYMDLPQAVAMVLDRSSVSLTAVEDADAWRYSRRVAELLGRSGALRIDE